MVIKTKREKTCKFPKCEKIAEFPSNETGYFILTSLHIVKVRLSSWILDHTLRVHRGRRHCWRFRKELYLHSFRRNFQLDVVPRVDSVILNHLKKQWCRIIREWINYCTDLCKLIVLSKSMRLYFNKVLNTLLSSLFSL